MKYLLTKLSEPGWELEFDTYRQVEDKLSACCCWECKEEVIDEIVAGECSSLLEGLLATPCGLGYDVKEIK